MRSRIFIFVALLFAVSSCSWFNVILHDDSVVARLGREKLYMSELKKYIPENASPQDSASYAERYIKAWATDVVFKSEAQTKLSKTELDVTEELENYRASLIKYRYEQRYINDQLDTLITAAQVREYYDSHKEDFVLRRPLLKVRFVNVMKDTPTADAILRMISADDDAGVQHSDSLARANALRYFDRSDSWMDAGELAKEFGIDWQDMMGMYKDDMIRIEPKGSGNLMVAYVCDMIKGGYAPVDYCTPEIRDIILSNRKYELLLKLERDLLERAEKKLQIETKEK